MITPDLTTPRLVLACLDTKDANETYRRWMSDPEVTRYLETRFGEPSVDSLRDYIVRMRTSTDSYFFGMFDATSGTHYGNIKLGPVSPVHGTASIGLVIGAKEAWGKGFASEAIGALAAWAFDHLGLDKLTAGSYARNVGSIRAFEKCGFLVEGVERSQVRLAGGDRDDVVILGRTRADHLAGAAA